MSKKILDNLLLAKRRYKASIVRQIIEIIYFRFRKRSKIGFSEYFDFSLFDSERYSFEEKRQFCGYRLKNVVDSSVNSRNSSILSQDKLIFYTIADNLRIPVPQLYGVFSADQRATYSGKSLTTRNELSDFLISEITYPFFAKPIHSWHGIGGYGVSRIDKEQKRFIFANGKSKPFDEFLDLVVQEKSGYIFQSAVTPHGDIVNLSGGRVCSLRCVEFKVGKDFEIHRVVWKIAAGDNMADNFKHGESGNLLAKIDAETGVVEKAFHSFGLKSVDAIVHPDTGKSLKGFAIPHWSQVKGCLSHASKAFPETKLQAWDVVVTEDGPVFLEMSIPMDLDLVQLAAEKGFCDDSFYKFFDRVTHQSDR